MSAIVGVVVAVVAIYLAVGGDTEEAMIETFSPDLNLICNGDMQAVSDEHRLVDARPCLRATKTSPDGQTDDGARKLYGPEWVPSDEPTGFTRPPRHPGQELPGMWLKLQL